MSVTVPTLLKSLSTAGAAISALAAWRKRVKGDERALIGELKDNLTYLDMVAEDDIALAEVIDKISTTEFKRLAKEGFDFNHLKRAKILAHKSLEGSELQSWIGKSSENLVEGIYDKINELKIQYPHMQHNPKYRWNVRINNIRKRIWLLLQHVGDD